MSYRTEIQLITKWVPAVLNEWLAENMPVDLTVKPGRWRGMRTLVVMIEADTVENLEAIRRAFNAMIEAKGYGPGANKK